MQGLQESFKDPSYVMDVVGIRMPFDEIFGPLNLVSGIASLGNAIEEQKYVLSHFGVLLT